MLCPQHWAQLWKPWSSQRWDCYSLSSAPVNWLHLPATLNPGFIRSFLLYPGTIPSNPSPTLLSSLMNVHITGAAILEGWALPSNWKIPFIRTLLSVSTITVNYLPLLKTYSMVPCLLCLTMNNQPSNDKFREGNAICLFGTHTKNTLHKFRDQIITFPSLLPYPTRCSARNSFLNISLCIKTLSPCKHINWVVLINLLAYFRAIYHFFERECGS